MGGRSKAAQTGERGDVGDSAEAFERVSPSRGKFIADGPLNVELETLFLPLARLGVGGAARGGREEAEGPRSVTIEAVLCTP